MKRRLRDVEIYGHRECPRESDSVRLAREEFIREFVEMFPEAGDHSASGVDAASALVNIVGRMTVDEVAIVPGVTRARVRQVETVALKKMRLAGGQEMREHWEHSQTRDLSSAWDCLELGPVGGG